MLDPRIYRMALLPVVLAVIVLAFSLSDQKGVVVVDVTKDGPAAEKGLKPGDVIMEAAQEEIKSTTQVAGKIDDAKKAGRKSILLLVERQGDLRFIALRLDQS